MSTRQVRRLLFEISIAQERLQFALDTKRDRLAFETQRQLANLNAMLVAETRAAQGSSIQTATYRLVFCESFQDGRVCSNVEYRALVRSMDDMDRATHVAIEIDGPIEVAEIVEQAVALEATERRTKKIAS